jgi:hypothetical protein
MKPYIVLKKMAGIVSVHNKQIKEMQVFLKCTPYQGHEKKAMQR